LEADRKIADGIFKELQATSKEKNKATVRIGFTGSPGVGKSTFIETFGKHLIAQQQKNVAVLVLYIFYLFRVYIFTRL
jgi:LAO/AO transport system kinase